MSNYLLYSVTFGQLIFTRLTNLVTKSNSIDYLTSQFSHETSNLFALLKLRVHIWYSQSTCLAMGQQM